MKSKRQSMTKKLIAYIMVTVMCVSCFFYYAPEQAIRAATPQLSECLDKALEINLNDYSMVYGYFTGYEVLKNSFEACINGHVWVDGAYSDTITGALYYADVPAYSQILVTISYIYAETGCYMLVFDDLNSYPKGYYKGTTGYMVNDSDSTKRMYIWLDKGYANNNPRFDVTKNIPENYSSGNLEAEIPELTLGENDLSGSKSFWVKKNDGSFKVLDSESEEIELTAGEYYERMQNLWKLDIPKDKTYILRFEDEDSEYDGGDVFIYNDLTKEFYDNIWFDYDSYGYYEIHLNDCTVFIEAGNADKFIISDLSEDTSGRTSDDVSGLYKEGTFTSWNDLLDNEIITVNNGVLSAKNDDELVGKLVIPDNITAISDLGWTWLSEIEIPSSVKKIGYEAFYGSSSLTSIKVSPDNKYYDSRENCNAIIETATGRMIVGCVNSTIPEGVKIIETEAFYHSGYDENTKNMGSITFPSTLEKIEREAIHFFYLDEITFLGKAPEIGENNFVDWEYSENVPLSMLKKITVPAGELDAYKQALPMYEDIIVEAQGSVVTEHTMIEHPAVSATCGEAGNIRYWTCSDCGKYFSDSEGKKEITADSVIIPAEHKTVRVDAKEATTTEPGNREHWKCSVCGRLFADRAGKTELTEESVIVPVITEDDPSKDKPGMYKNGEYTSWDMLLEDGIVVLEDGVVRSGIGLEGKLVIPDTVTRIAGFRWAKLEELYIPASVTKIDDEAIYGACSLTVVQVDPMNKYYDSRENCNAIIETSTGRIIGGCGKSTIPEGVKVIARESFYHSGTPDDTRNIDELVFPESLEEIEDDAITYYHIKRIVFKGKAPIIGEGNFVGWDRSTSSDIPLSMLESITVPEGQVEAYKQLLPEYADIISDGSGSGSNPEDDPQGEVPMLSELKDKAVISPIGTKRINLDNVSTLRFKATTRKLNESYDPMDPYTIEDKTLEGKIVGITIEGGTVATISGLTDESYAFVGSLGNVLYDDYGLFYSKAYKGELILPGGNQPEITYYLVIMGDCNSIDIAYSKLNDYPDLTEVLNKAQKAELVWDNYGSAIFKMNEGNSVVYAGNYKYVYDDDDYIGSVKRIERVNIVGFDVPKYSVVALHGLREGDAIIYGSEGNRVFQIGLNYGSDLVNGDESDSETYYAVCPVEYDQNIMVDYKSLSEMPFVSELSVTDIEEGSTVIECLEEVKHKRFEKDGSLTTSFGKLMRFTVPARTMVRTEERTYIDVIGEILSDTVEPGQSYIINGSDEKKVYYIEVPLYYSGRVGVSYESIDNKKLISDCEKDAYVVSGNSFSTSDIDTVEYEAYAYDRSFSLNWGTMNSKIAKVTVPAGKTITITMKNDPDTEYLPYRVRVMKDELSVSDNSSTDNTYRTHFNVMPLKLTAEDKATDWYIVWDFLEEDVEYIVDGEGVKTTKDISDCEVSGLGDKAWTGAAIKPSLTVTLDGKTLKKDKDYTVSYSNNKNAGTATVTITGKGDYDGTVKKTFEIKKVTLKYRAYVQKKGWMTPWTTAGIGTKVNDKKFAGTLDNLRMETIQMQLSGIGGSVKYRAYVQKDGWTQWATTANKKTFAGTKGQSKRVEMIQLKTAGQVGTLYDMYYRTYCEKFGWLGWAGNNEKSGSAGYSRKLEAFQVQFVPKGTKFDRGTKQAFYDVKKDGNK